MLLWAVGEAGFRQPSLEQEALVVCLRSFLTRGSGLGLGFCIFNKCPGEAEAAGPSPSLLSVGSGFTLEAACLKGIYFRHGPQHAPWLGPGVGVLFWRHLLWGGLEMLLQASGLRTFSWTQVSVFSH